MMEVMFGIKKYFTIFTMLNESFGMWAGKKATWQLELELRMLL